MIRWIEHFALECLHGYALHAYIVYTLGGVVEGRRVLKLGSSCGPPSAMALMFGATSALTTNHWEMGGRGGRREDNGGRLMPKNPHGMNLVHNIVWCPRNVVWCPCHFREAP